MRHEARVSFVLSFSSSSRSVHDSEELTGDLKLGKKKETKGFFLVSFFEFSLSFTGRLVLGLFLYKKGDGFVQKSMQHYHLSSESWNPQMSIQGQLLEVTVVGCTKLKDTEWISRQDPYVCLEYGSTKFRTRTCTDGGKNPTFQEKFVFTLIEGLRELNLAVWNSNTLTYDDFIGSGKVQLHKALSQGFDDTTWPLQTKTGRYAGEARVIVHYANAIKPATSSAPSAPPFVASSAPPHVSMYGAPPPASAHLYGASATAYPATAPAYPSYAPNPAAYPSHPPNPMAYPSHPPNPAAYPPPPYFPPPPSAYPPPAYPPPPAAYPPPSYPPPPGPPGPYPGHYPPPHY